MILPALAVLAVGSAFGCGGGVAMPTSDGSGPVTLDDGAASDASSGGSWTADSNLGALPLSVTEAGPPLTDAVAPSVSDAASRDSTTAVPVLLDAALDAAEIAPCLAGGYVFYADGESGYPGVNGPQIVTGASGTWSAGLTSGVLLQVQILGAPGKWALTAYAPAGFRLGTYQTQPAGGNTGGPWIQISANVGGCTNPPTGSFTVVELVAGASDQASVTRLLLSFDLTCGGRGTLRGCVSFGN
jgi:hypothetical protein